MHSYDGLRFDAPAPVVEVTFRDLGALNSTSNISMLLDSGADVSIVPRWVLTALDLDPSTGKVYETVAFDGRLSQHQAIELEMNFLKKRFKGRFLVVNDEIGIIGRNILNQLNLVFNGKQLEWHEVESK